METKVNELSVNGVAYVPKGSKDVEYDGELKICILQRGWVMVGRLERDGSDCKLHNASVIRCWGTTKGLGEIAVGGPINGKTVLDKCHGVVEFDWLTIVACVSCKEEAWANKL